ncbi:MAG: YgjP-like metallopeptidase domain-containing protein [Bacteroidales bacterium]
MKISKIDGIGEVIYIKRKNARRISVIIQPYDTIKVSIPKYISYTMAESYILDNRAVITKKMSELNKKIVHFDENTNFTTKWHKLKIEQKKSSYIEYFCEDHTLNINYPLSRNVYEQDIQQIIRKAIIETLRLEAKIYLPERMKQLAQQNNLHFNKIFIKNIKTQWGSCSYNNNINLNLHIMRLPDHLADYVLSHELCHTIHKNHSTYFWKLLSSIMNEDVSKHRYEIKNYSPQLFWFQKNH